MEQVPFLICACEQWPNVACDISKVLERCLLVLDLVTTAPWCVLPCLSRGLYTMFSVTTMDGWQEIVVMPMLSNQTGSKTVPADVAVRYVCSQLPKRAVVYTLHFACLCRYAFFFNLTSIENPGRRLFCLLRGPRCLDNATWCKLQPLKKFLLHFMCLFCFGLACWCCRVTHRFC